MIGRIFDSQNNAKKEQLKQEILKFYKTFGIMLIALIIIQISIYQILAKPKIENLKQRLTLIENYTGDIWSRENIIENKQEDDTMNKEMHRIPCKDLGIFRLTFYTPKELGASHANALRTAIGTRPREGRTIAVDPKIIKKNSLVYIEGWGYYIAEDTGSAIKGNRIDIFLNSYQLARTLGNKRTARVYLIKE